MFCLNDSTRYFLCPGSTDMRKGMFSLSGLIREKMNGDVRNGDVYIFINRLKNRIKLLHAETGGLVMYEKLLEEGTFKIPAYDPETFIQSNRILNDNERRYAEAGDGPHAGTACLADRDKPEAK